VSHQPSPKSLTAPLPDQRVERCPHCGAYHAPVKDMYDHIRLDHGWLAALVWERANWPRLFWRK
jgi:hypothetical protein